MRFAPVTSTTVKRVLVTALAAAVVVPTIAMIDGAFSSQAATSTISGVDVSRWDHPNGVAIDWNKVKGAGRSFAIVKATESTTYKNPYFVTDYKQAKATGMIVGAYHFARPKLPLSSASDQAKYYVSMVQSAGSFRATSTLPPVLDLEQTGGLSRTDLIAWTQKWLTTARALTGRTPMLYSYDSFVRNTLGNTTAFKGYPFWYARYTSVMPSSSMIPGGWQQWTMWQYSSTTNTAGIVGAGDVSLFNGTISALRAFADGRTSGISAPSEPLNLSAISGSSIAGLTWSPPSDNGGSPVNRYRVSVDSGLEVFTPTASMVAVGLAPGAHTFTVRAENIAGVGPASAPSPFTIEPVDPLAVITPVVPTLSVVTSATGSAYTSALVKVQVQRPVTGQALAGVKVSLSVRPELGPTFAPIVVTTGPDGVATGYVKAPIDATITASTVPTVWYSAGSSKTSIRIRPTMSTYLSTTSVKRTGLVRMTGGTTSLLAGEKAYRQIYSGGRWSTVASTVLSTNGRYSFKVSTATKGKKLTRVLLPESRRHLLVTSRTVVLTVR